jgi:hypothetical protein
LGRLSAASHAGRLKSLRCRASRAMPLSRSLP